MGGGERPDHDRWGEERTPTSPAANRWGWGSFVTPTYGLLTNTFTIFWSVGARVIADA